jgi:hypothetical protein
VVVRRPVRRDHKIARRHEGLLAFHGGIGPLAFEDEADSGRYMSVRGGDLAGQDHLDAREKGIGGARLAW